ncbi:MAG: hypothetical protein AAGE52_27835 [Myxococcota bacterium]
MRWVLLVGVCVVAAAPQVEAQDPYHCIDRLSDVEVRVRNEWLQERFDASKRRARWWWYGQITLWTGLATMQTVLAVRSDRVRDRFPNTVGTVGAWLTWLQLLVMPHTPAYAPQRFRRAPASTPEERKARLRYGLELLEQGAGRQELGGGPGAHFVPLLWSSFWGTYFSVRFEDAWLTARLVGGGLLVSEFRILSMPQQAVRDWELARGMICGADYVPPRDTLYAPEIDEGPEVHLAPSGLGLALFIRY